MDVPNLSPIPTGAQQPPQVTTPPAPEADGRAVADVAASKHDATPEVPLPVPATGAQSGLVSQAALKDTDAAPKLDTSGTSAAERTLKPYGVTMLPNSGEENHPAREVEPDMSDEDASPEA